MAFLRRQTLLDDGAAGAAGAYRELLTHHVPQAIPRLLRERDPGIALHGAFFRDKRMLPEARTLDPAGLLDFQRFARRVIPGPLPEWWAASLLQPSVAGDREWPAGSVSFGLEFLPRWEPAEITLAGPGLRVRNGEQEFVLAHPPKELFDRWLQLQRDANLFGGLPQDVVVVLREKDVTCIAIANLRGGSYRLFCLDTRQGRLRWAREVWGPQSEYSRIVGAFFRRIEIRRTARQILVFGSGGGVDAQAFDLRTGRPSLRFSTNYWGNSSERWPKR